MVLRTLLCLFSLVGTVAAQEGKQAEPPYSKPPKLELKFKDDFVTDSRNDYKVADNEGAVSWKEGKLVLGNGAVLKRKLDVTSWTEIQLDLEFPTLTKDGQKSDLKIWLDLDETEDSFVWFRQKRENGKTRSAVFIVETSGDWNQRTVQRLVSRELIIPKPLTSGKWTIEYRQGLWSVVNEKSNVTLFGPTQKNNRAIKQMIANSSGTAVVLKSIQTRTAAFKQMEFTGETKEKLSKLSDLVAQVDELSEAGKHNEAIPLATQVLEQRKRLLGQFHPDCYDSLITLLGLYYSSNDYRNAEPINLQITQIDKDIFGENHPFYATSLSSLGDHFLIMGSYAKAERLYTEAMKIYEHVLGKEHLEYARALNNLGAIHRKKGEFEKAEPLCRKALALAEKVAGKEHFAYSACLNNTANLYKAMGKYKIAEPLYLEAKAIEERLVDPEDPLFAITLNNLAGLYRATRDFEKSERLHLRAKAIQEKNLAVRLPDYATTLNDLAFLYESMKKYDKAEQLYQKASRIREELFGKHHPDCAATRKNLARLKDLIDAEK